MTKRHMNLNRVPRHTCKAAPRKNQHAYPYCQICGRAMKAMPASKPVLVMDVPPLVKTEPLLSLDKK